MCQPTWLVIVVREAGDLMLRISRSISAPHPAVDIASDSPSDVLLALSLASHRPIRAL